jgi:hypothetical protein
MAVRLSDSLANDLVDYLDTMARLGDNQAQCLVCQLYLEVLEDRKRFSLKEAIGLKTGVIGKKMDKLFLKK